MDTYHIRPATLQDLEVVLTHRRRMFEDMGFTERQALDRLAERELNEATQYYERERPGLGSAFLNEVQRCSRSIAEHPGAGRVIVGQVRRRLP